MKEEKMMEKEAPATFSIQFSRIGFGFLYRLRKWIKTEVPASDNFAICCLLNRDLEKVNITSLIKNDGDFLDLGVSAMYVNYAGQCSSIHECEGSENLIYFFEYPDVDLPFTELMSRLMAYIWDMRHPFYDKKFIGVYLGQGVVQYADICSDNISVDSFDSIYKNLERSKFHAGICVQVSDRFNKSLKINGCLLQVREGLRFSYDLSMREFIINTTTQIKRYRDAHKSVEILKDLMTKDLKQAEYAFPSTEDESDKNTETPKDDKPFGLIGIEYFNSHKHTNSIKIERLQGWINALLDFEYGSNPQESVSIVVVDSDTKELLETLDSYDLKFEAFKGEVEVFIVDDPELFSMIPSKTNEPKLRIFFINPKGVYGGSAFRSIMEILSVTRSFMKQVKLLDTLKGIKINNPFDGSKIIPDGFKGLDFEEQYIIKQWCEMIKVFLCISTDMEYEKLKKQFCSIPFSEMFSYFVDKFGRFISTKNGFIV